MNRFFFIAILAATSAGLLLAPRCEAAPTVVAAEPVHDFSKVRVGDQLDNTFILRNDGAKVVHILGATADCACVTATFDETIMPGKTAEVRVRFDTTDLEGDVDHAVTVTTDDGAAPPLVLRVKASVLPVLVMNPGYVRYVYVQKEAPGRVAQTLWAEDGADFKVLDISSPYPFLAVRYHEAAAAERRPEGKGRQWIVETELEPGSPVGALWGRVNITTDHPRQHHAHLQISGFVRPVIAVTPPTIALGSRPLEPAVVGTLRVQVFSTDAIEVTSVDSDLKGLAFELEPVQAGRDYKVRVSVTADLPKGDYHGTIRVHTASPKSPVVEVPISGHRD